MAEKQAISQEMATRWRRATKKQRGLMLDELGALTGHNRSYARQAAREPGPAGRRRRNASVNGHRPTPVK